MRGEENLVWKLVSPMEAAAMVRCAGFIYLLSNGTIAQKILTSD